MAKPVLKMGEPSIKQWKVKPENKDQLVAILTYHVVPGKVTSVDVVKVKEAKSVNGKGSSSLLGVLHQKSASMRAAPLVAAWKGIA